MQQQQQKPAAPTKPQKLDPFAGLGGF